MSRSSTKYEIAGEIFTSKVGVQKRCSRILSTATHYPAEISAQDVPFVLGLLRMHKDAAAKIGCGVRRVFIDTNEYGGRGFWLERVDGSRTDWGIASCLTPSTHREDALSAFRTLVVPQIQAFRDASFSTSDRVLCAISGVPVSKTEAHVDHRPPTTFDTLVEEFLSQCKLSWDEIKLLPHTDGATSNQLANVHVIEAWLWFHNRYAVLQITSARANLQQGAGRRP